MSQPVAARTLLLDLDGTLVDTAPDLAACLNRLLSRKGRAQVPPETVRDLVGRGARALIERAFARTGDAAPQAMIDEELLPLFLEDYAAHIADLSRPFPGVPETLATLRARGCRLAVATNKPQALTERLLEALRLDHFFDAVVGRDRAPTPKPHPAHLHHAQALAGGLSPAIMVGDSITDLEAGRAAGLPVILVAYGYTPVPARELGADRVIARFDQLATLIRAE